MKHTKKIVIPAKPETTKEVIDKVTCDLCSEERAESDNWPKSQNHNCNGHNVRETTVGYEYGMTYPEGGRIEVLSFDICPSCFINKLIPWVEQQGGKVSTKEIDY